MDVCDEPKQMVPIRREILDMIDRKAERYGERPEEVLEGVLYAFCMDVAIVPRRKKHWFSFAMTTTPSSVKCLCVQSRASFSRALELAEMIDRDREFQEALKRA